MEEVAQPIFQGIEPRRVFEDGESIIIAVAVFRNAHRMVTASYDRTLRLWDLKKGVVAKKMQGHRSPVGTVAVSSDGKWIGSGDGSGRLMAWDGDSGRPLTETMKKFKHTEKITSLDFSPDNAVLATVSSDKTIKLWKTKTWRAQGNAMNAGGEISCVRYSPSGEHLAIATSKYIQIWNPNTSESITRFRADHTGIISLAWMPNGTRLFSGASHIREWDTSTWKQIGDPWSGCTDSDSISVLAVNSTGTLIASASQHYVRLWRLLDQRTIAIFEHSNPTHSLTFSSDGKHILSGGQEAKLSEWAIPEEQALDETLSESTEAQAHSKILFINPTVRNACVTGNLITAQELLTQHIDVDGNNHNLYANRSFVFAQTCDWDSALRDALRSLSIRPSLAGYISKGIALCGRTKFKEAMQSFDLAFMFTEEDSNTILLLLLVKAITLFNANKHEEAMVRIQELAAACPNANTPVCHVAEAYLRIQLGINALNNACYNEAVDYFTTAINAGVLSCNQAIHSDCDDFVVLFGWDLASSWQSANRNRCDAFLRAGKAVEAHEAYKYMMNMCDEETKASCLDWSSAFKKECSALYVARGDTALTAGAYDEAIKLYSAAIDLDPVTDTIFTNRCKAKLEKMLWEEALSDAQKVTELNPSSYLGYRLKHAALHGARRYDEAIEAFQSMLFKLDDAHGPEMQALRQQYITLSEAQGAIRKVIDARMEDTPPRLINTFTGRLCDRHAQINSFKAGTEYKELLSLTMKKTPYQSEFIRNVVFKFFQYAMLSHRWGGKEPLLHDIQGKFVYELKTVDSTAIDDIAIDGIAKLQSFCKVTRDRGYRWAWSDTCCIDKNHNVDLQESVNSMFVWYRHSALTIVYLSDVLPSSKSGALTESAWIGRGWTVQEFLAPKVVLFYQKDWTLYLDDRSPNHKESPTIMQELAHATGINAQALIAFRPEMRGAREKLQWSSMRATTLPEDIAYSLFGIFGVHLSPIYGEKKQNALGRLLQEIIAQSGDITCLDWVGESSEFNSFLPASITSYAAPLPVLPSLSEDEMQTSISSLQDAGAVESVSRVYTMLDHLNAPRFAHRRLHLPCIIFTVTEVTPRPGQEWGRYFTYAVKADGLHDLTIATKDKLIPFSRTMPIWPKFLLIRPWNRNLLDLHDFAEPPYLADDAWGITIKDYQIAPNAPLYDSSSYSSSSDTSPVDSESDLRALRLIARLGQPFRAFLLAQQWSGEYRRITADCDITARVEDLAYVHDKIDVRTLEIL